MSTGKDGAMMAHECAERLTAELAQRVMKWTPAPDRYLTGDRSWMPRWKFQPMSKLEDAFRVLDEVQSESYTMSSSKHGSFSVEVRVNGKVGKANGESKPLVIALAVARALGLVED